MRKIIYYVTSSLDGFLSRSNGDIDWLVDDQGNDYGFPQFFSGIDAVLMGRKTYEKAISFGSYPYEGKKGFVFSRTARSFNHCQTVNQHFSEFVDQLRDKPGSDIWLIGGSDVARQFFDLELVDEIHAFVQPKMIGQGLSIVDGIKCDIGLELLSTQSFDNGIVGIKYRVLRAQQETKPS